VKDFLRGFEDQKTLRNVLAERVLGLGMKEASHFVRNVGLGGNLAILDRHILKNLVEAGIIKKMPTSISKRMYLRLEEAVADFSEKAGVPMSELDLLWWSKEAGEVFK